MTDVPPQAPPAPAAQEAPAFGGGMPYFDPDVAFREEMDRVYGPENPEAHLVNRIHGTLEVHGAAIDRHEAEFGRVREAHIEQRGYNTAMAGRVTDAEGRITDVEARVNRITGFFQDAWMETVAIGLSAIIIIWGSVWLYLERGAFTTGRILPTMVVDVLLITAVIAIVGHFRTRDLTVAANAAAPQQAQAPQPLAGPAAPPTEQLPAVPAPPPPAAPPQANP